VGQPKQATEISDGYGAVNFGIVSPTATTPVDDDGHVLPPQQAPPMLGDDQAIELVGASEAILSPDDRVTSSDESAIDFDDLIWVERAKAVVYETIDDPHKQAQRLQQLRALYLKERFGKEVGTPQD